MLLLNVRIRSYTERVYPAMLDAERRGIQYRIPPDGFTYACTQKGIEQPPDFKLLNTK